MLVISLSNIIKKHFIDSNEYYSMQSFLNFINYFFDGINIKLINSDSDVFNGSIYSIIESEKIEKSTLNILVCVENCNYWKHYVHYNDYGNYGDENIQIYMYNHIDTLQITDKYIAIPVIYLQINYFNKFYTTIKPSIIIPFEDKKFCLIATNIGTEFKNKIFNKLITIGNCDLLNSFKNEIGNKSCYHDITLLNIMNQYKFVFVSENSISDGYITEKIFNCYFSRIIPIYYGSKKINYFFNNNSFINIEDYNNLDNVEKLIIRINNNKELYESYINSRIINNFYDDENYKEKVNKFINNLA